MLGLGSNSHPCSGQVEREGAFGEGITADDLMPGGGDVPVTRANRGRFVELYARHLLEGAIARQFSAFRRGFEQARSPPSANGSGSLRAVEQFADPFQGVHMLVGFD